MVKDQRVLPHRRRERDGMHFCQQCDCVHGSMLVSVEYTVFGNLRVKDGVVCHRCLTGDLSTRWNVTHIQVRDAVVKTKW